MKSVALPLLQMEIKLSTWVLVVVVRDLPQAKQTEESGASTTEFQAFLFFVVTLARDLSRSLKNSGNAVRPSWPMETKLQAKTIAVASHQLLHMTTQIAHTNLLATIKSAQPPNSP
jgi:hypothetical protein